MSEDLVERVARAITTADGLDPDASGYAVTEETRSEIGEKYPLWKARIKQAQAAIAESSKGRRADFESVNVGSSPASATTPNFAYMAGVAGDKAVELMTSCWFKHSGKSLKQQMQKIWRTLQQEGYVVRGEITVIDDEAILKIMCDTYMKSGGWSAIDKSEFEALIAGLNALKPYLKRESLSYEQLKHALAATEAELEKLQKRQPTCSTCGQFYSATSVSVCSNAFHLSEYQAKLKEREISCSEETKTDSKVQNL